MRASVRIPTHIASARPPSEEEGGENRFVNRPCYIFNKSLPRSADDARCVHCRMYLTSACPHIDEFLDDVEDLSPE